MSLHVFSSTPRRDETPGPGAYESDPLRAFGNNVKYTIRPRYQEKKSLTANVDYPPTTSSIGGQMHTIGSRIESRGIEESLGPQYLPDPNEYFRKSAKIKSVYKEKDTSKMPGPADYSPQDWSAQHLPVQGARLPIRFDVIPDSPGPAAYSTRRELGKDAPVVSIRPRTAQTSRQEKRPGYDYNEQIPMGRDAPKYTISGSISSRRKDNGVPGPGSYDPDPFMPEKVRKIHTSFHVKTKQRNLDVVDPPLENVRRFPQGRKSTIGVKCDVSNREAATTMSHLYMLDSSLEKKSITIGKKLPSKSKAQTPGPTDYCPDNPNFRNSTSFSVKGPEARDGWLKSDLSSPGPGAYSISRENTGVHWSIGSKSRLSKKKSGSESQQSQRPETTR